jgi:hypothetical protein
MKINEASVIDNKVIDDIIDILFEQVANENNNITRKSIQSNLAILYGIKNTLKPLEPIVRNFHNYGQFAKMELLATGKINIHSVDQYIKQTEI